MTTRENIQLLLKQTHLQEDKLNKSLPSKLTYGSRPHVFYKKAVPKSF